MIALAALAGCSLVYTAAVAVALLRSRPVVEPDPSGADDALARWVLVRPCKGDEPDLAERLAEAGGARAVLLAVEDEDDAACPAIADALRELRENGVRAARVVTRARAPNRKAAQLARASEHPWLRGAIGMVVADSDVMLGPRQITGLVATMTSAPATCAASWVPPVEAGDVQTLADRASRAVLGASLHSFPVLAGIDPAGMVGKLFAVRAEALEAAGGFRSLTGCLGEDMELARRLRALGRTIALGPGVARSSASGRSWADVIRRYARWISVIRAQRPALLLGYPWLLAPLGWMMLALILGLVDWRFAFLGAEALVVRWLVACRACWLAGLRIAPASLLVDVCLADATLLLALGRTLLSRRVSWRGHELRIAGRALVASEEEVPSVAKEERQETFSPALEERRAPLEDDLERARLARGERRVDAREATLDPGDLRAGQRVDVPRRRKRLPEGNEQVRPLLLAEDVTKSDGDDRRRPGHARDLRGARLEGERVERRVLASLRKHPQGASRLAEEPRGVSDGARAVARIFEIDPERSDPAEEGEAPEVSRVHERVAVGAKDALRHHQRDQRVPPGGVVREQEHRPPGDQRLGARTSRDEDATEGASHSPLGVSGEPSVEPRMLGGRDHWESS